LLRELGQSANGYSLYKSLGVRRDATAQDIHAAYKVRSRQMHPDKRQQQGEDAAQATKDFQFLNRARQILGNPQTRAIYDKRGDEALDDDKLKRQHGEFSVV
jgi:DnaJ-class molecular chaperone